MTTTRLDAHTPLGRRIRVVPGYFAGSNLLVLWRRLLARSSDTKIWPKAIKNNLFIIFPIPTKTIKKPSSASENDQNTISLFPGVFFGSFKGFCHQQWRGEQRGGTGGGGHFWSQKLSETCLKRIRGLFLESFSVFFGGTGGFFDGFWEVLEKLPKGFFLMVSARSWYPRIWRVSSAINLGL